MSKITVHTLVKNEEKFLWFAVESVINYVDKVLLWDTGSTDKTVEIIKELQIRHPDKISAKLLSDVNPEEFTKVRQQMLYITKTDWFLILDGDEVWWEEEIKKLTNIIRESGDKYESIVTKYYNLVGDIYHYQDESVGKYKIDRKVGNLTIRAMRKIPGIHFDKPHGQQGIFDGNNKLIQERDKDKRVFTESYGFLHFTHLIRSESLHRDKEVIKRQIKYKYELGKSFPKDFYYPEVFFKDFPNFIKSPWTAYSTYFWCRSVCTQPFRFLKRKFLLRNKSGY